MSSIESPRKALEQAKRIVVKIGSRAITQGDQGTQPGAGRFQSIADQILELRALGRTVILVSSGAVAMGCQKLGITTRPKLIAELQAAAAIGQPRLIQAYEAAFSKADLPVAQLLLTHAEVSDRRRYLNSRAALDAMLARVMAKVEAKCAAER